MFSTNSNTNIVVAGIVGTGLLLGTIAAFSSFYINDEYERSVVTRLGEIKETAGPGFHWKTPFVDSVYTADTRMQQRDYANTPVATLDGQVIHVDLTVNHRIQPENPSNLVVLYEQFGGMFNYDSTLLQRMALDRMKSVVGQYPMEEFMPNRDDIRREVFREIVETATKYGIDVVDVQISNVTFSPAYRERLEDVARARAEASQAQQKERQRTWEANAVIEDARGRAESVKLEADANAYSRLKNAESEAQAIRLEGEARADAMKLQNEVLKNSQGLIDYTVAQALHNWDGSVPTFMSNGSGDNQASIFPFMNLNDLEEK